MEYRILRFRHNVLGISSIAAFENIKGGINNDCKDVYFVRSLGINASLVNDVTEMDNTLSKLMQNGRCRYKRIVSLPKMTSAEDAAYYSDSFGKWAESDYRSIQTRKLKEESAFHSVFAKACRDTLQKLLENTAPNATIEKNFIVKLLFWFDWISDDLLERWNERESVKIVAENITKKQEYLFFYFLTLLGFDVLLLQTASDIESDMKVLALSKEFVLGNFGTCTLPAYKKANAMQQNIQGEQTCAHRPLRVDVRRPSRTQKTQPPQADAAYPGYPQTAQNISGYPQAAAANLPQPPQNGSSVQEPNRPLRVDVRHPERERRDAERARQRAAADAQRRAAQAQTRPAPSVVVPDFTVRDRRELTFEELAGLASSVVMIAIRDEKDEVIGTGSGIMVGEEGYILTNNHVAGGAHSYSVRIEDDETIYDTDELIKYNQVLDLAVIRIAKHLKPLPIYQGPVPLVRGQKVVAIGSPLGFFNSVSDGIISGFRKIDTVDMIQFTAPTSPGSSGGALLNMYGEVIGISTAGIENAQSINLAMGYECINMFVGGFTGCRKN